MNNKGSISNTTLNDQTNAVERCSLCTRKDEEDSYIFFNLLYRIVTGHVFHQANKNDELNYSLDIPPQTEEEKARTDAVEDEKSNEEKLRHFKDQVSTTTLKELIALPEFNQLLKEVFKTKYGNIDESCQHIELSSGFSKMLGIKQEEEKLVHETQNNKERSQMYVSRIENLLKAIRKFKADIETYHTEINELSNHIVSRLFDNHSHLIKKNNFEEEKEDESNADEDDDSVELNDELADHHSMKEELKFRHKDFISKSGSSLKVSTAASSHGTSSINENGNGHGISFLSEKSPDYTSNTQKGDEKSKKASRYASFKSKLPKKATDILKSWFLNNIQNPYPSHEAKEVLSKMTGLSKKQIQNWFTNSRKRFLEPLKKKLDSSKKSSDQNQENHSQNDGQTSIHSKVQSTESVPSMNIESQTHAVPQQSQKEYSNTYTQMPLLAAPKDQVQNPFMSSQRTTPTPIAGPAMVYQGYIPTGQLNSGGSIVILNPYMMPQPTMMYPYRPTIANVVPINASFMPLSQGNITIMNQSNMVGGPYIVPLQPMNMRGTMGQNMSTSYSNINHNVFNNIHNTGSMGTDFPPDATSPKQIYSEMPSIQNEIMNQEQLIQCNGKSRLKPELDGLYTTSKHLHKDDSQDQT